MFQPRSYSVIVLTVAVLATLVLGGTDQVFGAQPESLTPSEREDLGTTTESAPNVYLSETLHDMGTAKVDETVSYQFVVENKGAGVLRIKDVAPG